MHAVTMKACRRGWPSPMYIGVGDTMTGGTNTRRVRSATPQNESSLPHLWRRWTTRPEHFHDVAGQMFVDLPVAWHRLHRAGVRIAIPIMLAAVTDEQASELLDGLDQVRSFHDTANSSTLRTPGICPPVRS